MNNKIKTALSSVLLGTIIATAFSAYAFSGTVDANDEISLSSYALNGTADVSIARNVSNYTLSYQWVEISNDLYKQIKQYKDELEVIKAFNLYEGDQNNTTLYDQYVSAQEGYKKLYGTTLSDLSNTKASEDISIIRSLLPNYTDNWTKSTNNKATIDLTSFSGTKDYCLWVKLDNNGQTSYDAETYEFTGTKSNSTVDESNTTNTDTNTNTNTDTTRPTDRIDTGDNIYINNWDVTATNGKVTINISRDVKNYELYYQWKEIDESTYNQIKKLEDELEVILEFNLYEQAEQDKTNVDQAYDAYYSAQQSYKEKYGSYVEGCSDIEADTLISQRNSLLLKAGYGKDWTKTTDNTATLDFSTFTGEKYFILWAKLVKSDGTTEYDGEIFEATGTKKDQPKPVEPDNNTVVPDDNTVKPDNNTVKPDDNTVKPDNNTVEPDDNTVKPDNNTVKPDNNTAKSPDNNVIDDGKKDDEENVVKDKKLPQTGSMVDAPILVQTIVGLISTAVASFSKFRRM